MVGAGVRRAAVVAGVLGLYGSLVVWLTWPLGALLTSHLPDTTLPTSSDLPLIVWTLAYESHALVNAPSRFFEGNIYYPTQNALFYVDTAIGALPYFLPTFVLTGNPTLANNLVFLGGVILTASALHLLIRHWTGLHGAGLVGACVFLVNPWTLWLFFPTASNYALLHYMPGIVLLAATPARRLLAALRLVPLLVLQCLTNLVYIAPAVLAPLGLLALGRLARATTRRAGLHLLAAIGLTLLFLAPFYAPPVSLWWKEPLGQQTVWRTPEGVERLWPLMVPVGRAYYPPLPVPDGLVGNSTLPTSLPYTALALLVAGALCGTRRAGSDRAMRSAWTHGALWAVAGIAISIPAVRLLDSEPIRLPHYLLLGWLAPGALEIVRVPSRLGLVALIGLAVLTGVGLAECARRLPRPALAAYGLAAVAVVLLCREYRALPLPYPLRAPPAADAPLVRALQREEGPVLELPVYDPARHATAMYRSIFHWRPLVNGYANYWPPGFEERMTVAQQLPEGAALDTLRRGTGLTTLVVRVGELVPPERGAWLALAERGGGDGLRLIAREEEALVFAVEARGAEAQPMAGLGQR
jgi:hypothetical protein